MNCKPGDLAVVVSARYTPSAIGQIVRCIRLITDDEPVGPHRWQSSIGGPAWLVEGCGRPIKWGDSLVHQRPFADRCLRPIRDPGEDARDETLNWLPVPERDEVPA